MVDEFSIEILDAAFNLALILRVRRMSKMSLNTMQAAPALPLLLKLRPMIRKYGLRKPPLPFEHSNRLSSRQLMVKLLQRHDEPAKIVDTDQKPPLLALNAEGSSKIDLPELIWLFGSKEVPALEIAHVPVLAVSGKYVVDGFPRQLHTLDGVDGFEDEAWKTL